MQAGKVNPSITKTFVQSVKQNKQKWEAGLGIMHEANLLYEQSLATEQLVTDPLLWSAIVAQNIKVGKGIDDGDWSVVIIH